MILITVLGGLLLACPFLIRSLARERRNRLLAFQLRQSLQSMVHGLQAGGGFHQALQRVAEEGDEPLAREWKTLLQSVQMGTSLGDALTDLGRRVPLKEMSWFVSAVRITQATGGSLAGVLDTLASTLQERETLREKVAALTAQGKASGSLLSAMPFLMIAALSVVAPNLVMPLFTTAPGQLMLGAVIVMVSVGGLLILKIVSIKAD